MLLLVFGLLWLAALLVLLLSWSPGIYLSLIFIWALPPMMLQIYFGADILWRYRGLVASAGLPLVLYLSLADALAIRAGTWTIDPAQSLQLYLGVLPLEEFIFFTVTTILIVWGNTLILARESHERIQRLAGQLSWLRPVRRRIEISSE
jgi:lycopene cyclase domain-containing protein